MRPAPQILALFKPSGSTDNANRVPPLRSAQDTKPNRELKNPRE